jgi:hypothetical protein
VAGFDSEAVTSTSSFGFAALAGNGSVVRAEIV